MNIRNLRTKIEDAFVNFEKNAGPPKPKSTGIVFIRIPETSSLTLCKGWAEEYFANYQTEGLDTVVIYQPVVATNVDSKQNAIHHSIEPIHRPEFYKWRDNWSIDAPPLSMEVLVGISLSKSTRYALSDGKNLFSFEEKYIYQCGQHYINVALGHRHRTKLRD